MTRDTDIRTLSCSETARLVRSVLKQHFPGTKFSVRSDVYAGGASIHVRWKDGASVDEVHPVLQQYAGSTFDPMVELKKHREHWLLPDGSVRLAHDPGTVENRGIVPPEIGLPPDPSAELVELGADFVFCFKRK